MREKQNILLFGLDELEKEAIQQYFGQRFTVLDVSECFTDILAIPARIIILNPAKISKKNYLQMNEVFAWDDETHIIFTDKPRFPTDVSEVPFPYYVEDEIEHISEITPLGVEEVLELEDGYEAAEDNMYMLLTEIEHSIRRDFEEMTLVSKTVSILNGSLAYRSFLDIVLFRDEMPLKRRTRYRHEILNMLFAFKLTCGMISVEEVAPFDSNMEEDDDKWNADVDYIISLSELLKRRMA